MKITISNWWILWFILFVLLTAMLDTAVAGKLHCDNLVNEFLLYLSRCFFELIAGAFGIAIGYLIGRKG